MGGGAGEGPGGDREDPGGAGIRGRPCHRHHQQGKIGLDKKSWVRFALLKKLFLYQPKKSFSGVQTVFTAADMKNCQSLVLVVS